MNTPIFFSWQADTNTKIGRNFLRGVLEKVCTNINSDITLEESVRNLEVDSDTQGVPGQPPIAETIFKKIDNAGVFIADMTFTGKRIDERLCPNPNVLIEYGWALKSLTHERVICIMNEVYGPPNHRDLPFDLAHVRWPITYSLKEDDSPEVKIEKKQKLIKILEKAIRESLATLKLPSEPTSPTFSPETAKDGPARFRKPGEEIGFEKDWRDGKITKHIFLDSGPAMWLRLIPATSQQKKFVAEELKKIAKQKNDLFPLRSPSGGYSEIQAVDGIGIYGTPADSKPNDGKIFVPSITFAFRTGEIWSIETSMLKFSGGFIPVTNLENCFVNGIKRYSRFLGELRIKYPFRWEAGLVGIKGMKLSYLPPPGKQWLSNDHGETCMSDNVTAQGLFNDGDSPLISLLPFFESIFEESGIMRPDYLPHQINNYHIPTI